MTAVDHAGQQVELERPDAQDGLMPRRGPQRRLQARQKFAKLLHDRLGPKLIEHQHVGWTQSHRPAQVDSGARRGRTLSGALSNRTAHNSISPEWSAALPPADAFLKTMSSRSTTTVAIINSL